jgi:hypothetical protein
MITMLDINAFGVSAATRVPVWGTRHAAATPAAAGKHRVAAATEASVDRGST